MASKPRGTPGRTVGAQSATSARKTAENASAIDESEYVSSAKSFRLENQESAPAVVSKRISLPARIPFVVSADNFSIVAGDAQVQMNDGRPDLGDIERGGSGDRAKDGKKNPGASGREKDSRGARAGSRARTTDASADTGNSSAGKSRTRTFSASPAGGTYYIYSFDGRLLAEYDLYGTCVRDYIYFGGQLIAEFDTVGSQFYYYTADQISSTRIVTNSCGAIVYSAAHDPYGGIQQTWPGNTFNPTPKFSGKERDGESDLDYFGARYYDRAQYRFITSDPIINSSAFYISPQRMDLYSYCINNPLSFKDIDGREIVPITLPGAGGKTLDTYLDSSFVGPVNAFIAACALWGFNIEINNAFRTQTEQNNLVTNNPKATWSLHSAGWAIDIDNMGSYTGFEIYIIGRLADYYGLKWGIDFTEPDLVHFYIDPWNGDIEKRKAAIAAADLYWRYYEFGLDDLSSMELYMIYGVFTVNAVYDLLAKANQDI